MMKHNGLSVVLGLSLLTVSFLQPCFGDPAFATKPSTTPGSNSTSRPTPGTDLPKNVLPAARAVPLPRLTSSEIKRLQADLTQGIDTWLGLAGMAKAVAPPPLSQALQNYRKAWGRNHAQLVTFLGTWRDSADYPYSVSIFPMKTPGQVCVLEFKPEWSLDIINETTGKTSKDVISQQILSLSIAKVQNGHLRSSQVRSVGSATAVSRFSVGKAYSVLFMGLKDDQGYSHTVALASPPALPPELPQNLVAPLSRALRDYGCRTELVP